MKLKIASGIRLTQEQVQEIANNIMSEPDIGWEGEYNSVEPISERHKAYEVELQGEHATYYYKVNISWGLITITKVS